MFIVLIEGSDFMRVLDQLEEKEGFTTNEKSIAEYVISEKENVLYLTIQELAQKTYTSHSAIIRFVQKLGLAGYKEFTIKLAQELQEVNNQEKKTNPNYPFTLDEQPIEIAKELANLMSYVVEKTYHFLEDDTLENVSHLINDSERIFIYALGDSQIRAKSFQNKMIKINKYVVIATELSEWSYHSKNLTPSDCAIFLSYHVKSKELIREASYLAQKNVPILSITAASNNELTSQSTHTILVPNEEDKFSKIGTFSSQISFEYVLNTIYSCIYKLDYDRYKQSLIDAARSVSGEKEE